ncbi:hypothetical protein H7100_02225 [Candidatus Saccharibacteria bacterium]|nr:hypothetical protein [Candidatus Saccharibacteria bacterium]
MNPDPNQTPEQPVTPAENPIPEVSVIPTDVPSEAPATETPNAFGGAPVSSDAAPATSFAQPTTTIGSSPNSNPTPNLMGDPKKKKLIILISAIVGVIVLLGIAAIVVFGLLFPSKADYRSAAAQFNTVSAAYSDLNSDASRIQYDISGSTTDTEFTNDSDSVNKSLQTFKDESKKLSAMKAVKIGEGQKLYATYESKVNAYVTYANDIFTSVKSFRPVSKACDDVTTNTLLGECVTALNAIGDVPNADLKQFVTVIQTQYKAYLDVKTKVAAIKNPYGDQYDAYKALRDQGYDIQDKISAASSDLRSNLSKHSDEIDPATAANDLGKFLVNKSNK